MSKRSGLAITVAVASTLLLVGCTSSPNSDSQTPESSRSARPSTSATPPRAINTPRASATPSSTPTGKSDSVKSLLTRIKPTGTPTPATSIPAKGSAVNLAAIAVAHWKKDTVVEPDTASWQQTGDTGTMRGTIITGKGVGQRYTFKLSKQGAGWRIDSATAL